MSEADTVKSDAENSAVDEKMKKDPKHRVEWSPENEQILVEWSDVAMCYRWMHNKAQQTFSRLHAWFTIPAIVLSTISGTASFAQTSLPLEYQAFAPMAIGAINIGVGILSTVQQYLKISELNESFRVSGISWDKFSRNIRVELAKAPIERSDAYLFLKFCRDEFDRLMETSPPIPPKIVAEFTKRFSGISSVGLHDKIKMERFEKLKKPDICDIIISAEDYRHPWYKEIERKRKMEAEAEAETIKAVVEDSTEMELRIQRDLIMRQEQLRKQEEDIREKMRQLEENSRLEHEKSLRREQEEILSRKAEEQQTVRNYILQFEKTMDRIPLFDEVKEHFGDAVDAAVVRAFFTDV